MSIYYLERAKELKRIGKTLGRAELAKRVLFCAEQMAKDEQYMGAIEFVGRMKAIAQACNFDEYWSEKVMSGFHKEMDDLRCNRNNYYGYCGKDITQIEKEVGR